tara:strand:+ start:183 stop:755 length:573 start_codon:yes stop_codon:yes gene_type:complete
MKNRAQNQPTQEYLKSIFQYNPETGDLYWKVRPLNHFKNSHGMNVFNARFSNNKAGSPNDFGYIMVGINGKIYLAHRLIWCLFNGSYPPDHIDHINHNSADNRIFNLRPATGEENQRNRSISRKNISGTIGVSWCKRTNKWVAQVTINGKTIFLGRFIDKADAIKAREKVNIKYSFHKNHGGANNSLLQI